MTHYLFCNYICCVFSLSFDLNLIRQILILMILITLQINLINKSLQVIFYIIFIVILIKSFGAIQSTFMCNMGIGQLYLFKDDSVKHTLKLYRWYSSFCLLLLFVKSVIN